MSGEAESDDIGSFGNRPATGARLVDNSAELPNTFGGGQEATDFLGLSQDLAGLEAGVPEAGASMDSGASGSIGPGFGVAPAPESDGSASWLLAPTEPPQPEDESEAEPELVEEFASVETGRPRRILSLAAAVLVIGAAVTIAMKLGSKKTDSALVSVNHPPVVHRPTPKPFELASTPGTESSVRQGILPNGETVPVTETSTATATETATATIPEVGTSVSTIVVEPAVEPSASPRIGAQRLAEWMSRNGWSQIAPSAPDASGLETPAPTNPVGWSATALLVFATRAPLAMPAGDVVEPPTAETPTVAEALPPMSVTSLSGEALANPSANSMSLSSGAVPAGAVRMASAADLAGIWNSDVVPMDLLDAETRIVTPAVGAVRVVLKTGEIFDGRLYAVGQGQVWLEMDIGRLALSARNVLRIDQAYSDKDAKSVDALPRMRVRMPGGLFFGKVLSRDEHHVTLRLDGGGRITLESTDVEPAPLGDTRVIGPEKP